MKRKTPESVSEVCELESVIMGWSTQSKVSAESQREEYIVAHSA